MATIAKTSEKGFVDAPVKMKNYSNAIPGSADSAFELDRVGKLNLRGGNKDDDLSTLVENLLAKLGEDPDREGLKDTPSRVSRSLTYLTEGYKKDPADVIRNAIFTDKYDEMVIVKDISLFSLCEHHLLPFYGYAHVAYIPDGKLVGLSKIARMVELYARRLQIQERITQKVAEAINDILKPKGVGVVIEAQHLCMQMRGVQKHEAKMITSAMLGELRNNMATRSEFMNLISLSGRKS